MKLATALAQVGDAALSVLAPSVARSRSDQPRHEVLLDEKPFQLRGYEPMLVAEVTVTGDRQNAADSGFRALADYIFANKREGPDIAMTTPVLQAPAGADPLMTVSGGGTAAGRYTVRFMMPHAWTEETLPDPANPDIAIHTIPAREMAVVTFAGRATDETVREQSERLREFIGRQNLRATGAIEYAYYDPPFTPPPLRRNEVMMGVCRE